MTETVFRILAAVLLAVSAVSAVPARAEDRLVLLGVSYGKNLLAICESDGAVVWRRDTDGPEEGHAGHHDIHLLSDGNILYHDSWTLLQETTLAGETVWSYDSAVANGNAGRRVNVHSFARLPNGDTAIAESAVGRILHVDAGGRPVKEVPLGPGGRARTRLMRVLEGGRYLVCAEVPGVVTEYDAEGRIVWEYEVGSRVYGAIRLANGNTMVCTGDGSSVVEVTPGKEVVWEIAGTVPGTGIALGWMTMLQELPNGNIAVGNCHAGEGQPQIFEITKDKEVVWQFDEWDLVGNGLACWRILEPAETALVREKLAALARVSPVLPVFPTDSDPAPTMARLR